MSRRAGRRDKNHGEVRQALRDVGCSVLDLGNVGEGCLDLLVATPGGRTLLMEVKDGAKVPSARKLTPKQERFIAGWKGETAVVLDRQQAVDVAMRERRS
jgi:hypothetical protein